MQSIRVRVPEKQIGRDRNEALSGKSFSNFADVTHQSIPLVDHDYAWPFIPAVGQGEESRHTPGAGHHGRLETVHGDTHFFSVETAAFRKDSSI